MMIMIDIITRIIRFQSILRGSLRTPFDWSDLGIFCYSISLFACQSAGIVAVKTYQKLPSWYQKGSGITGSAGYSALSLFGFSGLLSALGAVSTAFSLLGSAGWAGLFSS